MPQEDGCFVLFRPETNAMIAVRLYLPLATLLALSGCDDKKAAAPPPTPSVGVSQPLRRQVTEWDDFTGRFEAVASVEVRARVNGYLQEVGFKDGDIVEKNQMLFVIDPRPYEALAAQAGGQLAEARSRVNLGERELERGQQLAQTQAIATSQVDQRRQTLQVAQAAIVQAEANLRAAQLNVEFTRVTAPISGRISRKLVTEGNLVQGGDSGSTLLTTIVSLDPIQIYFDMDEATYLKNTRSWLAGTRPTSRETPNPVRIQLPDEDKPSRDGHMDFVDNRLDLGTGTLRGRALIGNKDLSLLPGQFARVQLIGSAPYDAVLLPDAAVATDQSRKIVFVVGADDTVQPHPVTLGRVIDGMRVIKDGLKPDDHVVVDGLQRIKAGQKVKPEPRDIGRAAPADAPKPDAPQPGTQAEAAKP